jgi:hypothetical protein
MADGLNATQGSLLRFFYDGPKTGWDLLQQVDAALARLWKSPLATCTGNYGRLRNGSSSWVAAEGYATVIRSPLPPPGGMRSGPGSLRSRGPNRSDFS